MVALDIFTGKKLEELCPSTHNMMVPVVKRQDYQLVDITSDGFVSLMGDNGDMRDDLKLPADEELAAEIKTRFEAGEETLNLTILSACGQEAVIAVKANTK